MVPMPPKDGKIYVMQNGKWVEIDVEYDNTTSGLEANNVQDAIDEIIGLLGDIESGGAGLTPEQEAKLNIIKKRRE